MKRPGWSFMARSDASVPDADHPDRRRPTCPSRRPSTSTPSSPSSSWFGHVLEHVVGGELPRGLVARRASSAGGSRRSSTASAFGKPIIRSIAPMSVGMVMLGSSRRWPRRVGSRNSMARKSSTSRCNRSPSSRWSAVDQRSSTSRRWASRTSATRCRASTPGRRDLRPRPRVRRRRSRPAPRSRAPAACAPADRSTPRPCRWTGRARRAAPVRARRSDAAARRRGGRDRHRPRPRARRARCGSPAGGRAARAPAGCGRGPPRHRTLQNLLESSNFLLRGGRNAGRRGPRRGSRGARRTRGRGPRGRSRR